MAFHHSVNEGDIISVVQTNLNIAIMRLRSNAFDEHIRKHDPMFFERERYAEKLGIKRKTMISRELPPDLTDDNNPHRQSISQSMVQM